MRILVVAQEVLLAPGGPLQALAEGEVQGAALEDRIRSFSHSVLDPLAWETFSGKTDTATEEGALSRRYHIFPWLAVAKPLLRVLGNLKFAAPQTITSSTLRTKIPQKSLEGFFLTVVLASEQLKSSNSDRPQPDSQKI